MTSETHTPNLAELDSANTDCQGDVALLGLAIDDVCSNNAVKREGSSHVYHLTSHQVCAITHSNLRMWKSVEDLAKAFYGPNHNQMT